MGEIQTRESVLNVWFPGFRLIKLQIQTGAAESGKTTLLKQMRIIYKDGFSLEEKMEHRTIIWRDVVTAFQTAIQIMEEKCFQYELTTSIVRSGLR